MSNMIRIKNQKNNFWHRSFLVHYFMFKNIDSAVHYCLENAHSLPHSKPTVLDIGCGNKPYKSLFADCIYIGVDRSSVGADPDIVANADDLNVISDSSADIVFSTQTIEHLPDPFAAICEMGRVLRSGGFMIITGPMYWPLHEEPYDFFRFTSYGFTKLAERAGMEVISLKGDGGTWAMIGQALAINLPRFLRPLILVTNPIFLAIDLLSSNKKSPVNYTVIAKKK